MPSKLETIVRTDKGPVRGVKDENDIYAFRGIPYAKPPVGNLRWREPKEADFWQDPPEAKRGDSCFQNWQLCALIGGGDPRPLSEDCLYLNVWTPRLGIPESLPVMVWIHGGGYVIGAGDLPPYVGTLLAKRQVVVVNINYRLGHLGFFAHPALDAEAERERRKMVNNFALLDQIAALEWVQRNIGLFGGNKNNVTIFGQSAGGRSVLSLFASPRAKDRGLFHKGVAQSVYGLPDISREDALKRGEAFAKYFGIREGQQKDIAEALRKLPADEFWLVPKKRYAGAEKAAFGGPVPISGDSVFPHPLLEAFENKRQALLPLIIGNNSDDSSVLRDFGFGPEDVIEILKSIKDPPVPPPPVKDLYTFVKNRLYLGLSPDEELGRQVGRDLLFTTMSFFIVKSHYEAGAPSWRYYFDYVADQEREKFPSGARHGDEVSYFLDTVAIAPPPGLVIPGPPQEITEPDVKFAGKVSEYWLQFAQFISDSPESIVVPDGVAWPKHEPASDKPPKYNKTMGFGKNGVDTIHEMNNFKILIVNAFEPFLKQLDELIPKSQRIHSFEGAPEGDVEKKTA